MHIKFLEHGTGSAHNAADYLTSDHDHKGEERHRIKVLRGDVYRTAAVADSLKFKYRYTSGVISFHPDEMPTSEQLDEILDEFEKTAFAGLDSDRYCHSVIQHAEADGTHHIHTFTARVDLLTGKSLNIAPPGWQRVFDPIRDYFNHKHGWKSPDIEAYPENARHSQPQFTAYTLKHEEHDKSIEPRQAISDLVFSYVESELIRNRDEVVQLLKRDGLEVPDIGQNYITVKDPSAESGHNCWRMKGAHYHEQFNTERTVAIASESGLGSLRGSDQEILDSHFKRIRSHRAKRAQYNRKTYGITSTKDEPGVSESAAENDNIVERNAHGDGRAPGTNDEATNPEKSNSESLTDGLARSTRGPDTLIAHNMGSGELPPEQTRTDDDSKTGDSRLVGEKSCRLRPMRGTALRSGYRQRVHSSERQREIHDYQALKNEHLNALFKQPITFDELQYVDQQRGLIKFHDGSLLAVTENRVTASGMTDDTAAEKIVTSALAKGWVTIKFSGSEVFVWKAIDLAVQQGLKVSAGNKLQQLIIDKMEKDHGERRRIDAAGERADPSIREAVEITQRIERSSRPVGNQPAEIAQRIRDLSERIDLISRNNEQEITDFKTRINLVEYLASRGYEKDEIESSRNAVIMRTGHHMLVVSCDELGQGIYFNAIDDKERGTIIDYVQYNLGMSVRQARKALRPWISHQLQADKPDPEEEFPFWLNPDREASLRVYLASNDNFNDYLDGLGIDAVQSDPRFANIKTDIEDNAIFPLYDIHGFSGYELIGPEVSRSSEGDDQGLWHSTNIDVSNRLVITDTVSDALMHAQLHHDELTAYLSLKIPITRSQETYLIEIIEAMNERGGVTELATENSESSEMLADLIHQHATGYEHDPSKVNVTDEEPALEWDETAHEATGPS